MPPQCLLFLLRAHRTFIARSSYVHPTFIARTITCNIRCLYVFFSCYANNNLI